MICAQRRREKSSDRWWCLKMKCNGKNWRKIGDSETLFFSVRFFFSLSLLCARSFVHSFLILFVHCRISRVINNTNRQLGTYFSRRNAKGPDILFVGLMVNCFCFTLCHAELTGATTICCHQMMIWVWESIVCSR